MRLFAGVCRVVWCVAALSAGPAAADVRLPAIFGDHMVLQQGVTLPVWGWAAPGEEVTVRIGDRATCTTADASGCWRVLLEPLKAGGPMEMTVSGRNTLRLTNVLAGEVWLCAGQSNMAMPVREAADADREIVAATFPSIRVFTVGSAASDQPQADVQGRWVECSPATVADFSAAGYFFGRELSQTLSVPVGLVVAAMGATRIEVWVSGRTLNTVPVYQAAVARCPEIQRQYEENIAAAAQGWAKAAEKARAEGRPIPEKPPAPSPADRDWRNSPGRPGAAFNAMVAPLAPLPLAGVVWYQGESNVDWPRDYRDQLPSLIADWRAAWNSELPFVFAQLPNFGPRLQQPGDDPWAEFREAQASALSVPRTGMAVTIDIGDEKNLHPPNKQEVSRRLALAALATAYRKALVYSGPMYESMSAEGDRIRLRFRHGGGGLVARGERPTGFAIAADDRKFVWAEAEIQAAAGAAKDAAAVRVWSPQVHRPVAVRYAWAANPECNLYNAEGLPAAPFRTDTWDPAGQKARKRMPTVVWIHLTWMLLAVAFGTWAGYLGLVRATMHGGKSPLPGRFNLRVHKWAGIVFYAMLYAGLGYAAWMVEYHFGAEPAGLWVWHRRVGLAIGAIYLPAMALGIQMLYRPAGVHRARPIIHMLTNFTACTLIAVQIALAVYAAGWLN